MARLIAQHLDPTNHLMAELSDNENGTFTVLGFINNKWVSPPDFHCRQMAEYQYNLLLGKVSAGGVVS